MKKRICVLLSILLLAAVLCACGVAPEKAVAGEWNWTLDLTDYIADQVGEIEGMDLRSDMKLEVFLKLTLNEDRSYRLTVDRDATEDSVAAYFESLKTAMIDAIFATAGDGLDRETIDSMFKQSMGMSVEEYAVEVFKLIDLESIIVEMTEPDETGMFKIKENKIYFPADSENYFVFTLEENALTLASMSGNPMDFSELIDEEMAAFPQTLTK